MGSISIAKPAESQLACGTRGTQFDLRYCCVSVGIGGQSFELGVARQDRELPADPTQPFARFTIWNPAESLTEDCAGGTEHFLGVLKRNTADEKNMAGLLCGHSFPPC